MLAVLAPPGRCDPEASGILGRFDPLKARLVADGFDEQLVEKLYRHPEVRFLPQKVQKYHTYKEEELDYKQFLRERFLRLGWQYSEQYQDTLRKANEEYGICPNIIVALLIVETRLGSYTGKHNVFNVLSSLAVAGAEDLISEPQAETPPELLKKIRRRAAWAYTELKVFLGYVIGQDIDPFSIKGSFAGAFGIPQFVPSSLLNFGCDGDGDGIVDLYNHHDAIMSVARYLSAHGWKEDASREHKESVLLRYNCSLYYVKIILELSDRLNGGYPEDEIGRLVIPGGCKDGAA